MGRLGRWISSGAWYSRIGRFAILLGVVAAFDQLLGKFGIDIGEASKGSAAAFTLTIAVLFLLVEIVFFPRVVEKVIIPADVDSTTRYCASLLAFATVLTREQKHNAVLRLRDANSHLLHLLGRNSDRVALGRLALESALARRSIRDRMAILIDDLGWTLHELGDEVEAKSNIQRALTLPDQAGHLGEEEGLQLALLKLKGLRHLAVMHGGIAANNQHLRAAKAVAMQIAASRKVEGLEADVVRDLAQLQHAEAMIIFEDMQKRFGGRLRPDQIDAVADANEALSLTEAALARFESIGDDERAAKALGLMQRLLEALGRKTEALEARARVGRVVRTIPVQDGAHG